MYPMGEPSHPRMKGFEVPTDVWQREFGASVCVPGWIEDRWFNRMGLRAGVWQ